MAINITTDMLYTRPGETDECNVISAHDPLILEFNDDTPIAGVATATVEFVVKDNDGVAIYTSDPFPAYLLSGGGGSTAYFYFDASEIIRHIIDNYFYKEMASDVISPEDYGSEIEVTIKTYDAGVLENTDTSLEYFSGHGVNQVGDEYGANLPRVFYNDTEDIPHFLGYPDKLFFYSKDDLVAETPVIEILPEIANQISAWTNDAYETFTSTGPQITSAIEIAGGGGALSNEFPINAGESIRLVFNLTLNSGTAPNWYLVVDGTPVDYPGIASAAGDNYIVLTSNKSGQCKIANEVAVASNFSTDVIHAQKLIGYSEEGTFGIYIHCLDLFTFQLTKYVKQVRVLYDPADPTLIKTWDLTVIENCNNGILVRWLDKNGFYAFWMFPGTYSTAREGSKIGNVINSFSEMALANSRRHNIGYRDSFDKITAVSPSVSMTFRRKLMELFTSPAVYLWQGLPTPDENLFYGIGSNNYDTLDSSGTVIHSAINDAGSAFMFLLSIPYYLSVFQGEKITAIFNLTLNSGQAPYFSFYHSGKISTPVQASAGLNVLTITVNKNSEKARGFFDNTAASNFSTGKIIVKRAEQETDWIMLEKIEGSHDLRMKKDADNFECTLVLPENFTQNL